MIAETAEKLDRFFAIFANGSRPFLLLDYDGTLAEFRVNRFTAVPWAGVRELLTRIQRDGRTRMAVVTGRPAAEINTLLRLESPVEVWGLHGAERLGVDGSHELEEARPEAQHKLDELRELLRKDPLGGLFEDKPNAAVMHWRGKSPRQARLIEERTRALFEPLATLDGLAMLNFEAGVELRVGRDKGGAVESILSGRELGEPKVYLGDDLTDEAAFRAINSSAEPHLSVLVRHEWRATDAEVWLRPPAELRMFLKRWIKATAQLPSR